MNNEPTNLSPTPEPQIEPLTLSLLGRFFGVPLLIIVFIVAGAVTVVILFGAPAAPAPRSLEALLQATETDAGLKSMGMLLPPDKEYWQTNLELAERIEKQEFTEVELESIAERLAAVVRAELAKLDQHPSSPGSVAAGSVAMSTKLEFLIRALGRTKRPEAVPVLMDVLATQKRPFINVAIQQLGNMHQLPDARASVPALVKLLKAPAEAETRMMASAALSVLAEPRDPTVIQALNEMRLAEEGEVAWNAALALARLGSFIGKSTLLDLLDREFWEKGDRYQVTDEKNQIRRFGMPPQRVDELLIATMDAASRLDDPEIWVLIERLASDKSLSVKAKAIALRNRREKAVQSMQPVAD